MTAFDPRHVAAALHEIRTNRGCVAPLAAAIAPRTEADGAAAQRALAQRMATDPPPGFKIGATGRRMQQYLGLGGPAAGFMPGPLHASGATLRFADYIKPGAECEVAVRLAHDLPPGSCTPAEAAGAIGELMAGIEIVENRYGDLAELGTPTLIADQMFHAAGVIGAPGPDWHGLDVPALAGSITIDGTLREQGIAADLLDHPWNCLAWLAGSEVARAFGGLRAGQVILLGSVTPPIWLDGPAQVTVAFPPLPAVSVTLV
jgi:2-keto-4-pentenoate hydratase